MSARRILNTSRLPAASPERRGTVPVRVWAVRRSSPSTNGLAAGGPLTVWQFLGQYVSARH